MVKPLLNIWSGYSLLRSTWTVEGLSRMAEWGYRTVGICDFESLAVAERFDREARTLGLSPLIGVTRRVRTPLGDAVVALYALGPGGYRSLCRPEAWKKPPGPELWGGPEVLCIAAPEVIAAAHRDGWADAVGKMAEAVMPKMPPSDRARSGEWDWIPFWPVRYPDRSGRSAYETLMRIGQNIPAEYAGPVPAPGEFDDAYPPWRDWTRDLLPRSVLPDPSPKIPKMAPTREEETRMLRQWALSGLSERYSRDSAGPARERLDQELAWIHQLGFSGYFLMVAEIVRHAREVNIRVGPGRGSAAGSLVSFCLGITAIDPLREGLIFERFLNPERQNLPDIDLDVDHARRAELFPFLRRRFGADKVAQITAFGTLGARAVLRDVGRALGVSAETVSRVMDRLALDPRLTLAEQRDAIDPALLPKPWLEHALALEGLPRHTSVHAAGVVIAPEPIGQWLPCFPLEDGWASQMEMASVERLGLVKLDILGLRTLFVVGYAEAQADIGDRMMTVPDDDSRTLRLLARGDTDGLFQLDGRGVRELLRRMRPQNAGEIRDVVALYRPGPMEVIGRYLEGRHNPHWEAGDRVAEICADTYGVMVYQEQLMAVVRDLAGYSWGQADLFRRAVSKKDRELLNTARAELLAAMVARGLAAEAASALFERILAFADYGFNKSHAAAYGRLAYYLAYLKAHFPLAFWSGELSSHPRGERLPEAMAQVVGSGIPIFLPHVNASAEGFLSEADGIRAGWETVRGLSRRDAQRLDAERDRGGPYADFRAFWERVGGGLDPKCVDILERAGALWGLSGPHQGAERQLSWFEEPPDQGFGHIDARERFGWPWPMATGPIYVKTDPRVSWEEAFGRISAWAARHRGTVPLVVALARKGQGRRVGQTVSAHWRDMEDLRALPEVFEVRRQIKQMMEVSHEIAGFAAQGSD